MDAVITMLMLRPYVFGFLAAFLFLAVRLWGWRRTILWLVLGYGIAWASEALSIRTGLPYGWYFYKTENLTRDILVAGVPIWDSLSYTFLIFAGYTTIQFRWPQLPPAATAMAGGAATMILDILIDPVANLGDRWFLGSIYYYPTGGAHFGVPISNYIGWFFVAWIVISVFQRLTRRIARVAPGGCSRAAGPSDSANSDEFAARSGKAAACSGTPDCRERNSPPVTGPVQSAMYPAFYLAIGAFNTAIAFWIGAWEIGWSNTVLLAVCAIVCFYRKRVGNDFVSEI